MQALMRHTATVYRPVLVTRTAVEIEDYAVVYRQVPCFAQPASSNFIIAHAQRGQEVSHVVYTTATEKPFKQHDLLSIIDHNGQERQLHVVATKDALMSAIYQELACFEYPQGAKKRLDRGDYP